MVPQERLMGDSKVSMKGVLYAIRDMDAYHGAYFKFSKQKAVCNPLQSENNQFYLKVAAISYADPIKIEGKKCKEIGETFRYTDNKFGSFVFYSKTVQKLRTITCARKNVFPNGIFPYGIGLLHSIIPRYNGTSTIVGIEVHYDDYSHREWTRYDGKRYKEHDGFTELKESDDFSAIVERRVRLEVANITVEFGTFVIYLEDNASLVMSDYTNPDLGDTCFRNRVNTLFQSGSIIICKSEIEFRFYDKEEGEEVEPTEMLQQKYRDLMPNTIDYSKLGNPNNKFALILKSTKSGAMWSLRVPHYKKPRYRKKKPIVLGIPTDGQFEQVFGLMEGVIEISRRMKDYKPWHKYIKRVEQYDDKSDLPFTDITSDSLFP